MAKVSQSLPEWVQELERELPVLVPMARAAEVMGLGAVRGKTTAVRWLREWLVVMPDGSQRVPRRDFLFFLLTPRKTLNSRGVKRKEKEASDV